VTSRGRKVPSFFRGILLAQAAKPSAERVHLTSYLVLSTRQFRRYARFSSLLTPSGRQFNSASFCFGRERKTLVSFHRPEASTHGHCAKFQEVRHAPTVFGVKTFGGLFLPNPEPLFTFWVSPFGGQFECH